MTIQIFGLAVARALEELQFHSRSLRILGTYPQGRKRG